MSNDIIEEIKCFAGLTELGLIQFLLVPFNSKVYHTVKKHISEENALNEAFDESLFQEIEDTIKSMELKKNLKLIKDPKLIPEFEKSMKDIFFETFFNSDGKFITYTYEQFKFNLAKGDYSSTVAIVFGLLVDAVKSLPSFANINPKTNLITAINERLFLKG